MNASKTALVAVMTIGSLGLVAGSASACGGGGGFKYGGFYSYPKTYVKKVYVQPVVVEPCYYPAHSFVIVAPGDTWYTLSLREYGKPHLWKKIAIFNGLPLNAGLAAGMTLKLPEIHPNGAMLPSSAPAPLALAAPAPIGLPQGGAVPGIGAPQANFNATAGPQAGSIGAPNFSAPNMGAPNGAPNGAMPNGSIPNGAANMFQGNGPIMPGAGQPNFGQPTNFGQPNGAAPKIEDPTANLNSAPTANVRTVSTEERLPSVAIGSVLTLDGQSFGNERGIVRLKVGGITLPIQALEWNATLVKIQLPQLDLSGAMKAEIEVLRADSSLASKSTIELTPAVSRLAMGD